MKFIKDISLNDIVKNLVYLIVAICTMAYTFGFMKNAIDNKLMDHSKAITKMNDSFNKHVEDQNKKFQYLDDRYYKSREDSVILQQSVKTINSNINELKDDVKFIRKSINQ